MSTPQQDIIGSTHQSNVNLPIGSSAGAGVGNSPQGGMQPKNEAVPAPAVQISAKGGDFYSSHHGGMEPKNKAQSSPEAAQDIIGLIRELQNWHTFGVENHELEYFNTKMKEHFPSIAQALTVAVEALEDIRSHSRADFTKTATEEGLEMLRSAKEALSRIRSLSLS